MKFFETSEIFGMNNLADNDHRQSPKAAINYDDREEVETTTEN